MQSRVERELGDADAALLLLNGEQGVGPGDRFIAGALARAERAGRDRRQQGRPPRPSAHTLAALQAAAELEVSDDIFPLSARKGTGVEALVEHLVGLLPAEPVLLRRRRRRPTRPTTCCSPSSSASRSCGARSRRCRTPSRSSSRRSTTPREDLVRVRALRLGRDRVAEGHPHRRPGPDDQGDRDRRAARARARARHARAPRPRRSACAAAGAATTACWTGSASSRRSRRDYESCATTSSTGERTRGGAHRVLRDDRRRRSRRPRCAGGRERPRRRAQGQDPPGSRGSATRSTAPARGRAESAGRDAASASTAPVTFTKEWRRRARRSWFDARSVTNEADHIERRSSASSCATNDVARRSTSSTRSRSTDAQRVTLDPPVHRRAGIDAELDNAELDGRGDHRSAASRSRTSTRKTSAYRQRGPAVSDAAVDILLIGGGIASANAAAELRERRLRGLDPRSSPASMDPPYHRPPLTKGYLQGREDRAVDAHPPRGVVRRARRRAAHAHAGHGPRHRGADGEARPRDRRLRAGARRDRRAASAACRSRAACATASTTSARSATPTSCATSSTDAERVVVVGGSYIATEVAASMTLLGKRCTLVMQEALPMERGFGPVAGAFVRDLLTGARHRDRRRRRRRRVRRRGRRRAPVEAVVCADGRRVEADLVVVGVGANPDVMLARKAELELGESGGVACDQRAAHVGRGDLRRRRHVRVRQRRARPAAADRARGGRRRAGPPRRARDARLRRAVRARSRTSGRTSPTGRRSSTSARRRRGTRRSSAAIRRAARSASSTSHEGRVAGALAVGRGDDLDAARDAHRRPAPASTPLRAPARPPAAHPRRAARRGSSRTAAAARRRRCGSTSSARSASRRCWGRSAANESTFATGVPTRTMPRAMPPTETDVVFDMK